MGSRLEDEGIERLTVSFGGERNSDKGEDTSDTFYLFILAPDTCKLLWEVERRRQDGGISRRRSYGDTKMSESAFPSCRVPRAFFKQLTGNSVCLYGYVDS